MCHCVWGTCWLVSRIHIWAVHLCMGEEINDRRPALRSASSAAIRLAEIKRTPYTKLCDQAFCVAGKLLGTIFLTILNCERHYDIGLNETTVCLIYSAYHFICKALSRSNFNDVHDKALYKCYHIHHLHHQIGRRGIRFKLPNNIRN